MKTCAVTGDPALFGQDQLAESGGLKPVERAVVKNANRLVALEQGGAFQQLRGLTKGRGVATTGLSDTLVVQNGRGSESDWHVQMIMIRNKESIETRDLESRKGYFAGGSVMKPILRTPASRAADIAIATRSYRTALSPRM